LAFRGRVWELRFSRSSRRSWRLSDMPPPAGETSHTTPPRDALPPRRTPLPHAMPRRNSTYLLTRACNITLLLRLLATLDDVSWIRTPWDYWAAHGQTRWACLRAALPSPPLPTLPPPPHARTTAPPQHPYAPRPPRLCPRLRSILPDPARLPTGFDRHILTSGGRCRAPFGCAHCAPGVQDSGRRMGVAFYRCEQSIWTVGTP